MVGLDDPLDDGEAEPGTGGVDVLELGALGCTGGRAAVADLEEPLTGVVVDPAAAVDVRPPEPSASCSP